MEKYIGFVGPIIGHTHDTHYDFIFTSERLVAINTKHPMDTTYSFGMTEQLFGTKLIRRQDRFKRTLHRTTQKDNYETDDFDDLIRKHPHSFAIPYSFIVSTDTKRKFFKIRLSIEVKTSDKKRKIFFFTIPKDKLTDLQQLLDSALPK